jgi:single-strand DNA-binding protein
MKSFNQCIFVGHAGSDPKLLTTGSGKTLTKFRLGVSGYHKKEEPSDTLWLTVLVWREELATVVSEYVKTGSLVLVSGRLSQRSYTDGERQERITLELTAEKVELLGTGKPADAPHATPAETQSAATI